MLKAQWREAAIFHRRQHPAIAQSIADQIRRRIVTGDLPRGHRLPSIPKLARLYAVSVSTAQSAVHILAALGFVRVSRGNGTYVAHPRTGTATLTHAFLRASVAELAQMRAAIDERTPVIVARQVRTSPAALIPRTLSDINFRVGERSAWRWAHPEDFVRADLAFHEAVISSVRGMEIAREVYVGIGRRLTSALLPVASVLAADTSLEEVHHRLAGAVLNGEVQAAARAARAIAVRELRAVGTMLG